MSNLPGPERGVFCILIIDLISRSALVVFILVRARSYYYKKGPVIVDNITILMIHGGLFCINFLYSILLRWEININFISIYDIFLKMAKTFHCILNYNNILIFVIFQIEISSIIFSQKFRICAFFVLSVTIFLCSQSIPWILFLDLDINNQPSFAICWSSGKK